MSKNDIMRKPDKTSEEQVIPSMDAVEMYEKLNIKLDNLIKTINPRACFEETNQPTKAEKTMNRVLEQAAKDTTICNAHIFKDIKQNCCCADCANCTCYVRYEDIVCSECSDDNCPNEEHYEAGRKRERLNHRAHVYMYCDQLFRDVFDSMIDRRTSRERIIAIKDCSCHDPLAEDQ